MTNFVYPDELTLFVESIRRLPLEQIGSKTWLEFHETVVKLNQQALLEASDNREEAVVDFLITRNKLKVLVHEIYCASLWKTRVLPYLLETNPNPEATFLIYSVFFHEATAVSLLETGLFHENGCATLEETSLDLVDYCAQSVAQVIGLASMAKFQENDSLDVDESVLSELERQKRGLIFKIGLRCVSILHFMVDRIEKMSLGTRRRLVVTHDIPWLIVDLLCFHPWFKKTKKGIQKYIDDKWKSVEGDETAKVIKYEAQAWFCLRQILFNPVFMEIYEINDERREQLSKCQGLLNDRVLDQLPPLVELKQYLCNLSIAGSTVATNHRSDLVLEELPEILEELLKEAETAGGFGAIASRQEEIFLCNDTDKIRQMAQRLSEVYSSDILADLEDSASKKEEETTSTEKPLNKCGKCQKNATKRCGVCRLVFYCSKECQVEDWSKHQMTCKDSPAQV